MAHVEKHCIIVVIPHYWGRGKTVKEAWARLKQERSMPMRELQKKPHQIYAVFGTDEAFIDEMGSLRYPKECQHAIIQEG